MKGKELLEKIRPVIQKRWKSYGPLLLVVLVGLILLLLPTGGTKQEQTQATPEQEDQQALALAQEEKRIEETLTKIKGVGRVRVLLTLEDAGTNVYALDENITSEKGSDSVRESSGRSPVLYNRSGGGQEAMLERVQTPRYRGAVIVCEGGTDPEIQLSLLQTMSSLLGLSSDKVAVLPMDPKS